MLINENLYNAYYELQKVYSTSISGREPGVKNEEIRREGGQKIYIKRILDAFAYCFSTFIFEEVLSRFTREVEQEKEQEERTRMRLGKGIQFFTPLHTSTIT